MSDPTESISDSQIAELIVGETDDLYAGVCRIRYTNGKILVFGESGHVMESLPVSQYIHQRNGQNGEWTVDIEMLREDVVKLVRREMEAL